MSIWFVKKVVIDSPLLGHLKGNVQMEGGRMGDKKGRKRKTEQEIQDEEEK